MTTIFDKLGKERRKHSDLNYSNIQNVIKGHELTERCNSISLSYILR